MANGLFEGGYVRIPWDDKNEPDISVPAVCAICGRNTGKGIKIDHDGHTLGFCTNRHYVEWWKTIHDDDSVNPEDYELPEGRHK